jgi:hypothetical protein
MLGLISLYLLGAVRASLRILLDIKSRRRRMTKLKYLIVLIGFLAAARLATAAQDDLRRKFVGKSPCALEFQSKHSDFSLRLDKTEKTTLLYRDLSKVKILMIVQPTGDDNDHCGVIRDLIQITHVAKDFEFRCFDPQAPTDVVFGTSIRHGSTKLVSAIDAWRVDLKTEKFVQTQHQLVCSADGWDGEDDGGDMVDNAKTYAAHGKPGQIN